MLKKHLSTLATLVSLIMKTNLKKRKTKQQQQPKMTIAQGSKKALGKNDLVLLPLLLKSFDRPLWQPRKGLLI